MEISSPSPGPLAVALVATYKGMEMLEMVFRSILALAM